jgi:hypothetical protein
MKIAAKVLGLDVPVRHAAGMSDREHVEHLIGDAQAKVRIDATAGSTLQLAHRRTLEQLHHQEHRAIGVHAVGVDAHHARMTDGIGEVRLA